MAVAVRIASWCVTALFGAVAVFQVALLVGAPWGALTQGGKIEGTLPPSGRLLAAVSVVVVLIFWLGLSGRAGWGPWKAMRPGVLSIVTWLSVGYLALGLVMNAASQSPAERTIWVPVIAALLAGSLVIALGTRHRPALE